MSFRDYLREELNRKSTYVLARGLQEMHDAPDQQKPQLSKEVVERILAQYQKQEDPDMTHNDAIFFGDNPEGRSRVQKYAPIEDNPKETEQIAEATVIPSKKEAAVAFATSHYNKKHGTNFSKHDVHGYLFGNQANDEFHNHVASNHNVEDKGHIEQAFGIPHDHPSLNESEQQDKHVVIINGGPYKQSVWPSVDQPKVYGKAEAEQIASKYNSTANAFDHAHVKHISDAHNYVASSLAINAIQKLQDEHDPENARYQDQFYESETVVEGDPCWKGYKQVGMKEKNGKKVPNCVPVNESTEPQEVDMDDHEQLHAHVHNAISSGYDLELELADGSVVYIEPHQLQHFKNKNAIPALFGALGSQEDFQNYLNSVYAETEPTAKHGPDPDPYKDVVPSPDKAMEVHDRPDPVMEAALTKLGRQKQLASVEPGESITVNVPKRGLISGRVKAIKGGKTIIVDQEGKEHEVETEK